MLNPWSNIPKLFILPRHENIVCSVFAKLISKIVYFYFFSRTFSVSFVCFMILTKSYICSKPSVSYSFCLLCHIITFSGTFKQDLPWNWTTRAIYYIQRLLNRYLPKFFRPKRSKISRGFSCDHTWQTAVL